MRIAFVTCYYGREEHVRMTEAWYEEVLASAACARREHPGLEVEVFVLDNGAERLASLPFAHLARSETNLGFARGMGHGIERALARGFDYCCVINNDVMMPERSWLSRLLDEIPEDPARRTQTLLPLASHHNGEAFRAEASRDEDAWDLPWGPCPAVCWVLPHHQVRLLHEIYGIHVFHHDFRIGWYEDDLAAQMLFAHYEHPFRVVPRAWVQHLHSKTSKDRRLFGRKLDYKEEARAIHGRLLDRLGLEAGVRARRSPFFGPLDRAAGAASERTSG